MDRDLKLKFVKALNNMDEKNYLKSMIAYGAAPTIEGKKPSSLMNFTSQGKNLMTLWRQYGTEICKVFNLESFELKVEEDRIIVLLYRKGILDWYVNHRRNQPFLQSMGYSLADSLEQKLFMLRERFYKLCPHEVGIFLGIPVEDVEGFIAHKGRNCLMCRYWKVYGNPQRAKLLFNAYDLARSKMAEFVVNTRIDRKVECV